MRITLIYSELNKKGSLNSNEVELHTLHKCVYAILHAL